jgi:hypothetical protein
VVTKASYRGIEPLDTLLTTAVMKDSEDPLGSTVVETLLNLPVRDSRPAERTGRMAESAAEAVDEAIFSDQAAV